MWSHEIHESHSAWRNGGGANRIPLPVANVRDIDNRVSSDSGGGPSGWILRVVQEWQSKSEARGVLAAIATSDETVSVAVGQAGAHTDIRGVRVDDAFDVQYHEDVRCGWDSDPPRPRGSGR